MAEKLKYARIIQAVRGTPWAILPERLADIMDVLDFKAGGGQLSDEEVRQYIGINDKRAGPRSEEAAGGIQVLSLRGIISHRAEQVENISGPGGTSVEKFRIRFRQAMNNNDVRAIIIDVDSPGGSVDGVPELGAEMLAARGRKPVLAVANTLSASAAYWLATAADEVSVTPSGEVGSIGVFAAHDDVSARDAMMGIKRTYISAGKYKVDGNPFEPLSPSAREFMQERVDAYYDEFVAAVAAGRRVSEKTVREGFGEGRVVGARQALELGMVDRIESFDDAVARMRSDVSRRRAKRAELRLAMT